ncbi:MAG: MarR family transcriptional regulator [Cyanobacteria bacterium SID2]|nr:MarR family transcriptional regulator [Cyanobacteria bacterium SID2]MBP0003308.1 MarR family transcriptional regulator [Cyanobacteria bacterium SBC]
MMKRTSAGQALESLIFDTAATFFLLRARGSQLGVVTPWGAGYGGLLRSLKLDGPQTVPQLARSRPVSRQHIQKLANEMLEDGTIEYIDNPAHKRSKLLRLTPHGEAVFETMSARITEEAERLADGISTEALETTLHVLETLRDRLRENLSHELP